MATPETCGPDCLYSFFKQINWVNQGKEMNMKVVALFIESDCREEEKREMVVLRREIRGLLRFFVV